MIIEDFPCICGHGKSNHAMGVNGCLFIYHSGFWDAYGDGCLKYIPDNLRYLEQQVDKYPNRP
jgi:hypothetical protein